MGRRKKNNKKVPMYVWIDPELNEAFRNMIQAKYDKFEKGLLSLEVELALRNHLAAFRAHRVKTNPHPASSKNKIYNTWLEFRDYMVRNMGLYELIEPGGEIHVNHLKKAIGALRGGDSRTINKWLRLLVEHKILKPVSQYVYKILPPTEGV